MDLDRVIGKLTIQAVAMAEELKEGKELVIYLSNDNLSIRARKKRK